MELSSYALYVCSAVYAIIAILIAICARHKANSFLAICCGITAVWAASGVSPDHLAIDGIVGILDLARMLAWYFYLLYLYDFSQVGPASQIRGFYAVPAIVLSTGLAVALISGQSPSYTLYSWPMPVRLVIYITELLLIENLYLNLPERSRWHVALPCVLLGGLACFDILVVTDSVIFHRPSISLLGGRTIAMIIVAPLLLLTAIRGKRWRNPIHLSRAAVFHSATLVLSGSLLLSLAAAGEILRQLDATLGWVAELSLVFAGVIGICLCLSSRSARSVLDRLIIHHFFADRYDYRSQWLSCIETLSGRARVERTDLHTRAIQAVADVVDSPSGAIFTREHESSSMAWASSWNMPAGANLLSSHPLILRMADEQNVVDLRREQCSILQSAGLNELGPVWLAVPLLHSVGLIGIVIVGPPRVAFRTDQEVFDLLTILGREVGTYIAEQRLTETVLRTRSLHDYGKRFAFVAHDVKNISSQLGLLLSNAEHHLAKPEFQQDMLETVRASVQKIERMLRRLDNPSLGLTADFVSPVAQLELLLATYRHNRQAVLKLEHDGRVALILIGPEAFDTAMLHILNNAVEASSGKPVLIQVQHDRERVIIDIVDQGNGMSPEFVRDELFSPFKTNKDGGSGIGAFQARELITEAGGQLSVISQEGFGTTVRVVFTHADRLNLKPSAELLSEGWGD